MRNILPQLFIYFTVIVLNILAHQAVAATTAANNSTKVTVPQYCTNIKAIIDQTIQPLIIPNNQYANVTNGKFVGAMVGVYHNQTYCYFSYGQINIAPDAPSPDFDTQFEIGSNTKTFTALLLQLAAYEGKLGAGTNAGSPLDNPINNFLPPGYTLPQSTTPITFRMVANFTAGFPDSPLTIYYANYPQTLSNYTSTDFASFIASMQLPTTLPTTIANYSNVSYMLLGQILQFQFNYIDYISMVSEKILTPLQLNDTGITPISANLRMYI